MRGKSMKKFIVIFALITVFMILFESYIKRETKVDVGDEQIAVESKYLLSGIIENGKRVCDFQVYKSAFTPDPLVVLKGEKVLLKVKSFDGTQGFVIPELNIKSNMPTDTVIDFEFTVPDSTGSFAIFSTVFTGSENEGMKAELIVVEDVE